MLEYYLIGGYSLIFLIIATIKDIRDSIVQDSFNIYFFGFSVVFHFLLYLIFGLNFSFIYLSILNGIFYFIIGLIFFKCDALGAGDSKLLINVGLNIPSASVGLLFISNIIFLVYMLIIGISYYYTYKFSEKNKLLHPPFVPVIFLTYLIFYLIFLF